MYLKELQIGNKYRYQYGMASIIFLLSEIEKISDSQYRLGMKVETPQEYPQSIYLTVVDPEINKIKSIDLQSYCGKCNNPIFNDYICIDCRKELECQS